MFEDNRGRTEIPCCGEIFNEAVERKSRYRKIWLQYERVGFKFSELFTQEEQRLNCSQWTTQEKSNRKSFSSFYPRLPQRLHENGIHHGRVSMYGLQRKTLPSRYLDIGLKPKI